MSRNPVQQRLISIVEPVCQAAGFELVDLRFLLEQGGWVLRVCVDLPLDPAVDPDDVPADRVDLHDCEDLSRELSAVLDVDDPIPQAYSLEVGSPGIDRPLRTPEHYRYFAGSEVKIQLAVPMATPSGERRNFRGILRGIDGDRVAIEVDGQPFHLALADIDHAKLVPDWDAVMKGKRGVGHDAIAAKPGAAKPGDAKPGAAKPGHRRSARSPQQQQHTSPSKTDDANETNDRKP